MGGKNKPKKKPVKVPRIPVPFIPPTSFSLSESEEEEDPKLGPNSSFITLARDQEIEDRVEQLGSGSAASSTPQVRDDSAEDSGTDGKKGATKSTGKKSKTKDQDSVGAGKEDEEAKASKSKPKAGPLSSKAKPKSGPLSSKAKPKAGPLSSKAKPIAGPASSKAKPKTTVPVPVAGSRKPVLSRVLKIGKQLFKNKILGNSSKSDPKLASSASSVNVERCQAAERVARDMIKANRSPVRGTPSSRRREVIKERMKFRGPGVGKKRGAAPTPIPKPSPNKKNLKLKQSHSSKTKIITVQIPKFDLLKRLVVPIRIEIEESSELAEMGRHYKLIQEDRADQSGAEADDNTGPIVINGVTYDDQVPGTSSRVFKKPKESQVSNKHKPTGGPNSVVFKKPEPENQESQLATGTKRKPNIGPKSTVQSKKSKVDESETATQDSEERDFEIESQPSTTVAVSKKPKAKIGHKSTMSKKPVAKKRIGPARSNILKRSKRGDKSGGAPVVANGDGDYEDAEDGGESMDESEVHDRMACLGTTLDSQGQVITNGQQQYAPNDGDVINFDIDEDDFDGTPSPEPIPANIGDDIRRFLEVNHIVPSATYANIPTPAGSAVQSGAASPIKNASSGSVAVDSRLADSSADTPEDAVVDVEGDTEPEAEPVVDVPDFSAELFD